MTDANGLPLTLVVAAANTHDIKRVADTLDSLQTGHPGQKLRRCLDKGYDVSWLKTYLQSRHYEPPSSSVKGNQTLVKPPTSRPSAGSSKDA